MFVKFTNYKLNYQKIRRGQLAPFLIAVIVVLIIAVFVTVDIGKVSLHKTYTANSSDAASLAAASVLATGLNTLCALNEDLAANTLAVFIEVMITVTIALVLSYFFATIVTEFIVKALLVSAVVQLIAWQVEQYFKLAKFKKAIKKMSRQAKDMGFRLAYANLNIASALPENKKDSFESFMSGGYLPAGGNTSSFQWENPPGRRHYVQVEMLKMDKVRNIIAGMISLLILLMLLFAPIVSSELSAWNGICCVSVIGAILTLGICCVLWFVFGILTIYGIIAALVYLAALITALATGKEKLLIPVNIDDSFTEAALAGANFAPMCVLSLEDKLHVSFRVKRFRDKLDTGLWQEPASTIESESEAITGGGKIWYPDYNYDAWLIKAK